MWGISSHSRPLYRSINPGTRGAKGTGSKSASQMMNPIPLRMFKATGAYHEMDYPAG
jgi:hypothetical protein